MLSLRTIYMAMLACILSLPAHAVNDITQLVPFQGRLHNSEGNVVADGVYDLTYYIYDTATGGEAIWSENHSQVSVIHGYVNVLLGATADGAFAKKSVDFSTQKYLSISINGGQEMFPRHQLVPTFHAYDAKRLGGKDADTYAQIEYVDDEVKKVDDKVGALSGNFDTAISDRFVKSGSTVTNKAKNASHSDYAVTAGNANNLGGEPATDYARTDIHETFGSHITVNGDVYTNHNGGGDAWHQFYDDNSNTWRSLGWDDSQNKFVMENNSGQFFPLGIGIKTLFTGNVREVSLSAADVKKGIYYVVHSGNASRFTATLFVDNTTSQHLGVGGDHHVYFDGPGRKIGTGWGNIKAIYFVEIPNGF